MKALGKSSPTPRSVSPQHDTREYCFFLRTDAGTEAAGNQVAEGPCREAGIRSPPPMRSLNRGRRPLLPGLTFGHVAGEPARHIVTPQREVLPPGGPGGSAQCARSQPHRAGSPHTAGGRSRHGPLRGASNPGRRFRHPKVPAPEGPLEGSGTRRSRHSKVPAPEGSGTQVPHATRACAQRCLQGRTGPRGRGRAPARGFSGLIWSPFYKPG